MNALGAEARFFRIALAAGPAESHALLRRQGLREALLSLGARQVPDPLAVTAEPGRYESERLALFEVGVPHAPVPLAERHWLVRRPANQVILENHAFHRAFGFALQRGGELPDHLGPQLAFVEFLLWAIEAREAAGRDASDLRRALGDFAHLHLESWVGLAAQAAREARAPPVFAALLDALAQWVGRLAQEHPATGPAPAAAAR